MLLKDLQRSQFSDRLEKEGTKKESSHEGSQDLISSNEELKKLEELEELAIDVLEEIWKKGGKFYT